MSQERKNLSGSVTACGFSISIRDVNIEQPYLVPNHVKNNRIAYVSQSSMICCRESISVSSAIRCSLLRSMFEATASR